MEEVCEDIPTNNQIIKLSAFDPSLTNQSLCFSIRENEYFRLQNDTCNLFQSVPFSTESNGIIVLKKSLFGYDHALDPNPISFNAFLFYCYQSEILYTQIIMFNVIFVNKYPPSIVYNVRF